MKYGCITIILILIFAFGVDCLFAYIFQLLWNWLVPLFWTSAPILTFWQSFGVFILLTIIGSLFKSTKV